MCTGVLELFGEVLVINRSVVVVSVEVDIVVVVVFGTTSVEGSDAFEQAAE
jgi:hypothetical protein